MFKLVNKLNFYLFLLLMITMMNYRSLLVDKNFGKYTDCLGCYKTWVLSVDAKLMFFALIVLFLSFHLKNYFIRVLAKLLVVAFTIYYLSDIYLYKSLNQRLYFSDLAQYFNMETIVEFFNRDLGNNIALIFVFLVLMSFITLHKNLKFNLVDKSIFVSLFILLVSLVLLPKKSNYVHSFGLRNIYQINFKSTLSIDYEDTNIGKLENKIDDVEKLTCDLEGLANKKNIILLVWESLSMYHSQLFSGINDWTPNLDKLAVDNRYYTNFFANNFNSSRGRIALLTGEKTFGNIDAKLNGHTRVGYWNTQRNIPKLLKRNGYSTSFLDGANLDFTKTGEFMTQLGFDYVEGQEYEGYKNKARYAFKSVSDEALLERVTEYINTEKQPFFSTVITVTTHPPFIHPESKHPSQETAVKYTDKIISKFYQTLDNNNFFDDGILVIVSDHRSMTPVSSEEYELFHNTAVARIPLVVIDKSYVGVAKTSEYLQQSDLLNSIEYLVSKKHCKRNGEGNIFSNPAISASCVFHNRGDYRDNIDLYCENGNQTATIKLNGSNTQLIKGSVNNEKSLIEMINVTRIGARNRHIKLFEAQK